jgi:hypothetical protein
MSKRVITFAFRPGVPRERQKEVLAKIGRRKGIEQVEYLKPDAKLDELSRLCFLYLNDDADANRVIAKLAAMPEIESASSPSPRGLI